MNLLSQLLSIVALSLIAVTAHARSDAESPESITAALPAASSTNSFELQAPVIGDYTIHAGIKSQNTAGRTSEFDSSKGRRYKLKNEYFVGATNKNGWGGALTAVTTGTTYGESSLNKYGDGDPSITLVHPSFYKDANLNVWGQLRRYFPVSNHSKETNQQQTAYYLFSNFSAGHGVTVFNQLTPRYFQQTSYKPGETNYYAEDFTTVSKKFNSWFKYGVGQHAQVEWHDKTSTGSVVEVFPMADFVISSNIYIEPRFYMPVYSVNSVYDAPKAVALSQTQAEVYMQISM